MLSIRVTHMKSGHATGERILQGESYHVTMGPDACVVTIFKESSDETNEAKPPTKLVLQGEDRAYVMNEQGVTIAHLPPRGTASRASLRHTEGSRS